MKCSIIIIALSAFFSINAHAQDTKTNVKGTIHPYPIGITYDKTVHLIFPYAIKSVDRGSSEVMVQKAEAVENVLQVKAGVKNFTPTNLTIITAEGALYSFLLNYNPNATLLNLKVSEMAIPIEQIAQLSENPAEAETKNIAKRIAHKKRSIKGPTQKAFEMKLGLNGIFIKEDILYFQFETSNNSSIKYDIDQFRLYIKDAKKTKRTASQELELTPVLIEGNISYIDGRSNSNIVVAIEKVTIPQKKYLYIELMERNGGRNLKLKINNSLLLKAKTL